MSEKQQYNLFTKSTHFNSTTEWNESTLVDQKMRLSLKLFNHPNNILKQFVILVKQVSGFWIQSILLCIILYMIYHTATHIITIYGQYVTTPPTRAPILETL